MLAQPDGVDVRINACEGAVPPRRHRKGTGSNAGVETSNASSGSAVHRLSGVDSELEMRVPPLRGWPQHPSYRRAVGAGLRRAKASGMQI